MPLFAMNYTRSVVITPCTGEDRYGARTYGEPFTVPAITTYLEKNIKDFRGNVFITAAWVAIPPEYEVTYNSMVELPDGTTPYVGSVSDIFDEEAEEILYKEVYVGRIAPGEGSL